MSTAHEQQAQRQLAAALRRWWRRRWRSNMDVMWGHLCADGEGCQR